MSGLATHIGRHPPGAMYTLAAEMEADIDCQCARCGSSILTEHCEYCEDGYEGHDCGEDCCACLYPEDNVPCQYCDGTGIWHTCASSSEWCQANPLPGRETVKRGQLEWFLVRR